MADKAVIIHTAGDPVPACCGSEMVAGSNASLKSSSPSPIDESNSQPSVELTGGRQQRETDESGRLFVVQGLTVKVVSSRKTYSLIDRVSFHSPVGEVLGFVGASGSGKTSLFNALAGRCPSKNHKISGHAWYTPSTSSNPSPKGCFWKKSQPAFPRLSYVIAQQRFPQGLTVQELLSTTAALRMSRISAGQRTRCVKSVLMALDLWSVKDVIAFPHQGASELNISAKKRLALATETLADPDILLVDEPTSGLDFIAADRVMEHLRWLARNGLSMSKAHGETCERLRYVFCTLHQPSRSVLFALDRVAIVSGQRIVFCGPPSQLQAHIEATFPAVEGLNWQQHNPADVALHLWALRDQPFASVHQLKMPALAPQKTGDADERAGYSQLSNIHSENISLGPSSGASSVVKDDKSYDDTEKESGSECAAGRALVAKRASFEDTSVATKTRLQSGKSLLIKPVDLLNGRNRPSPTACWCTQLRVLLLRGFTIRRRSWIAWLLLFVAAVVQGAMLGTIFWKYSQRQGIAELKPHTTFREATATLSRKDPIDAVLQITRNSTLLPSVMASSACRLFDELIPGADALDRAIKELNFTSLVGSLDILNKGFLSERQTQHLIPSDLSREGVIDLADGGLPVLQALVTNSDLRSVLQTVVKANSNDSGILTVQVAMNHPFLAWRLVPLNSDLATLLPYIFRTSKASLSGSSVQRARRALGVKDSSVDNSWFVASQAGFRRSRALADVTRPKSSLSDQHSSSPPDLLEDFRSLITELEKLAKSFWMLDWAEKFMGIREGLTLIDWLTPVYPRIKKALLSDKMSNATVTKLSNSQPFTTSYSLVRSMVEGLYGTMGTVFNVAGSLFFLVLFLGFATYGTLLTFPYQRALFNKETADGLYTPSAYSAAGIVSDLMFHLVPGLLMAVIFYYFTGLNSLVPTKVGGQFFGCIPQHIFIFLGICAIIIFSAHGFVYMISALSPSLEVAVCLAPFFMIVWLTLAGFFMRDNDLPQWILWFRYTSFYRWGYFALASLTFPSSTTFGVLPSRIAVAVAGVTETSLVCTTSMIAACGVAYYMVGFVFLKYFHRDIGLYA